MKYKLIFWELKSKNFNKKENLLRYCASKRGVNVKLHELYENKNGVLVSVQLPYNVHSTGGDDGNII